MKFNLAVTEHDKATNAAEVMRQLCLKNGRYAMFCQVCGWLGSFIRRRYLSRIVACVSRPILEIGGELR